MARWLVDTNVLLRLQEGPADAYEAVITLGESGEILCVTPQVLVEFWCAATRPTEVNGLGWTLQMAATRLSGILRKFVLLEDSPAIFDYWQRIVKQHKVKGKKVHDARLAAVMQAHGVENILTFNVDDFSAFSEIRAVHPAKV